MATVELGPDNQYRNIPLDTSEQIARRPLLPAIRWGAVIAGVAVGISVQLLLTLLGVATGLSAMDISQGEHVSGVASLIWGGISMLISGFIGGYVAARMTGLRRMADGVLHGAVAWAVTTLLFAILATSVTGSMISGIFINIAPTATRNVVSSNASDTQSRLSTMLKNQFGITADANTIKLLQDDLQAGRRDDALQVMTGPMNIDPIRAGQIVDQALILSGSPQQASPQGRAATDDALNTASTAAWAAFLAVILSLAVGIGGGVLGSMGTRRDSWTRHTADAI